MPSVDKAGYTPHVAQVKLFSSLKCFLLMSNEKSICTSDNNIANLILSNIISISLPHHLFLSTVPKALIHSSIKQNVV